MVMSKINRMNYDSHVFNEKMQEMTEIEQVHNYGKVTSQIVNKVELVCKCSLQRKLLKPIEL